MTTVTPVADTGSESTARLKRELRVAQAKKRTMALMLIAPLAIFLLLIFVVPIAALLTRAVQNPEVATALPHTVAVLRDWDRTSVPPDAAYVALTRETPEVIAEFSHVRHHDQTSNLDYNSHAFYVQVASRLPNAPKWKPYARFERLKGDADDPVFGALDSTISTAGVRYELTDLAALKGEYRHTKRIGEPYVNGVYAQVAFTFGD